MINQRRLWLESFLGGALWVAICVHWRPVVYNFDGYVYPFQGLAPLEFMNAHHLFWIPAQAFFDHAALKAGIPLSLFCQMAGILMSGVCLMLVYVLAARLSQSKRWSVLLTVFLAFSPQYWFLATQNLPYIPFFIAVMLALWSFWRFVLTSRGQFMVYGIAALAMAVQFQQAGVFLFFPLSAFLAWREWRIGLKRWRLLSAGLALAVGLVCGPYLLIAHAMDIDSIAEFRGWVTDYLQSQHGFQFHALGLIQAVIGIFRCLVASDAFEAWLLEHARLPMIAFLYSILGGCGVLGLLWCAKRLRPKLSERPLFFLCLGMMAAWSGFIFIWEPLMPHFWCLDLFLGIVCLATTFSSWKRRWCHTLAVLLLGTTLWNAYANVQQDRREQPCNPNRWLTTIDAQLGPKDQLLFLARNRVDHRNYDLLITVLLREHAEQVKVLLPDYWTMAIGRDIETIRHQGGHVWISSLVLNPDAYQNLARPPDIFSPYPIQYLRHFDAQRVFHAVSTALAPYNPQPSALIIGNDRFLKIT